MTTRLKQHGADASAMFHSRYASPAISVFALLLSAGCLTGCGGGGGGGGSMAPPAPTFSLAQTSLMFSAPWPTVAVPNPQNVMASVTGSISGTLYILIDVAGPAVSSVTNFTVSGNSGSATVSVPPSSSLGGGTFSSTLTVHACLNSATCASGELAGSPQTVNVTYTIGGPALVDTLSPHVVVQGMTGQVIMRGKNFTGTTAVAFGSTPATAFTVGDSFQPGDIPQLLFATYPASLSLGTQAINLTGNSQAFTGTIAVVAPQGYAAASLNYPQPPSRIIATVWDAARQALYVAAAMPTPANDVVWRYTYAAGTWSAAQTISVPNLQDLALPGDGSKLMALTQTAVLEFDAGNPTIATRTVTAPFTGNGAQNTPDLLRFAFTNDGSAILATGLVGMQATADEYLYAPGPGTFFDLGSGAQLPSTSDGITAGFASSGDGSMVTITQSSTVATPIDSFYFSTQGRITADNANQPQILDEPAALDNSASRIIICDGHGAYITDAGQGSLGTLPFASGASIFVVLVNPQATRAYALVNDGLLHSYDLTTAPAGMEIGSGVMQAPPSTSSPTLRTAITPDGATLFIAGDAGVAVIPAPN